MWGSTQCISTPSTSQSPSQHCSGCSLSTQGDHGCPSTIQLHLLFPPANTSLPMAATGLLVLPPPGEDLQAGTDSGSPTHPHLPYQPSAAAPAQRCAPPKGTSESPSAVTAPHPQAVPKVLEQLPRASGFPQVDTTPLALTFLHRDGRLLLPQPQEDEEEHQGDEDLKGQHPLGMTQSRGIMTPGDRTRLPRRSMGRMGVPRAPVQHGTVPVSCRWLVALSQLSQRQTGHWAAKDFLLAPACSILPGAPRDRRGYHREGGPLLQ